MADKLVVLIAVLIISIHPARLHAKQTWTVTAGATTKDFAVVANTFQPRIIEVAVGDTVTWKFRETHTVSFMSGRSPLDLWFNAFLKEGDRLVANPQVFFPVGERTHDGRSFHNSGIPSLEMAGLLQFRYSLTFTNTGTFDYICLLHGPTMSGRVIVKDRVTVNPAAVEKRAQTERAQVLRAGQAVWARLSPKRQGSTTIVTLIGDPNLGYSIYRFTREPLVIARGSTVTWQMRDPEEIHTVTFTSGQSPPEVIVPEKQKQGPPKLVIPARVVNRTETTTYDGTGFVHSGILYPPNVFPGDPPTSFSLTFTRPGQYTYQCLIHDDPEGMRGTIIVR
jgi:plastocyanin